MGLFDNVNQKVTVSNSHQGAPNFKNTTFTNQDEQVFEQAPLSSVEANKLIRNTYMLLSMTLLFSAATAGIAMVPDTLAAK